MFPRKRRGSQRPRNRHIDLWSYNPLFTEDFTDVPLGRGRGRGGNRRGHFRRGGGNFSVGGGFGQAAPPPGPSNTQKRAAISLFDTPGPWTNDTDPQPLFPSASSQDPPPEQQQQEAQEPDWTADWEEVDLTEEKRFQPEIVLRNVPAPVREAVVTAGYSGQLTNNDAGRLRAFITGLMRDGVNPFPVVRAFRDTLATLAENVFTPYITKLLDFYHVNGYLADDSEISAQQEVQQPDRFPIGPKTIFFDREKKPPIDYKVSEIPGVSTEKGQLCATKPTIRWIRTVCYGYSVTGEADKVDPFIEKMRNIFGQFTVDRALNESQKARMDKVAKGQDWKEGHTDNEPQDPEVLRLKDIMHHLTYSQVPGVTGVEDKKGLSPTSIGWIRKTLDETVTKGLNPDPFIIRITAMFSAQGMRRIFGHRQFVSHLRTQIDQLAESPTKCLQAMADFGVQFEGTGPVLGPGMDTGFVDFDYSYPQPRAPIRRPRRPMPGPLFGARMPLPPRPPRPPPPPPMMRFRPPQPLWGDEPPFKRGRGGYPMGRRPYRSRARGRRGGHPLITD